MDFEPAPRAVEHLGRVTEFMERSVYPAELVYGRQLAASDDRFATPAIVDELKAEARGLGLWNLFLQDERHGPALTNLEYAPLAEAMGRSPFLAPHAMNCSALDTGNMELLHEFGTHEQKERWLAPLLEGEIRSCFSEVASPDATNIRTRIRFEGDEIVVEGRKWWSSGAMSDRCKVAIVMGVSDPGAERHRRHSMVLVPLDTVGVRIELPTTVFGYDEAFVGGHAVINFDSLRVPATNVLGGEGDGFAMAQARLGPGRIHHCMRLIGMAERALELLCRRAEERVAFGAKLSEQGVVRDWIAESRLEIDQARLLVQHAAWTIDRFGKAAARDEISGIKVAAARMATVVIDRAIQTFGAAGLSADYPLVALYAEARLLRIADGPDEVHKAVLARRELAKYRVATVGAN